MAVSPSYESSIIIPVFNQWVFSKKCLETLAETLLGKSVEVIVIDNASSDQTPDACPLLGNELFASSFKYVRCEKNLNFGPASNLGARMASGQFLIFLNNDIELLPGWYEPLLRDFSIYPDIAATGPILLYPAQEPFGHTVQHLGIFVSPDYKVGHLYEGISAQSPLVGQRRFFQAITAACMVMRRDLFLDVGLFDEHYVNGLEDVDLCARLFARGLRMTVNPEARIIHHTSQTRGQYVHDQDNTDYFRAHSQHLFFPDWYIHCANDGLNLCLDPFLSSWRCVLPKEKQQVLDSRAEQASFDELRNLLITFPHWEKGWHKLIAKATCFSLQAHLRSLLVKFFYTPLLALAVYRDACKLNNKTIAQNALSDLLSFCCPWEKYRLQARNRRSLWQKIKGMEPYVAEYTAWLTKEEQYQKTAYEPFLEQFWEIARLLRPLAPDQVWAYTLWQHNVEKPRRKTLLAAHAPDAPGISLLMPLTNADADDLGTSLASVLAQSSPHWELCLTAASSLSQPMQKLVEKYAARDTRIHVQFLNDARDLSTLANTALEMARFNWVCLLHQEDRLAKDALACCSQALADAPDTLLLFTDAVEINEREFPAKPYCQKSTWDEELLRSGDFAGLPIFQTAHLRKMGAFRSEAGPALKYDVLLRYSAEKARSSFLHLPFLLFHKRALQADSDIHRLESARCVLEEHLNNELPGTTVSIKHSYFQPHYPHPDPFPSVNLIIDMTGEQTLALLESYLQVICSKTAYKNVEICLLYDADIPLAQRARAKRLAASDQRLSLHAMANASPQAERLNCAVQEAHGEILGFLRGDVLPLTEGWLEELVSVLCRKHVATVAGKLISRDQRTLHAGYLVDAEGILKPLFHDLPRTDSGYLGYNCRATSVDALDGLCLFTKRATWSQNAGFDACKQEACVQDFCLRLGETGLRNVWWPYVEFLVQKPLPPQDDLSMLRPGHSTLPNLCILGSTLSLS